MYLLLNMLVEFLSIMTYQDNFFNDCSQVAEYHFYIKNIKWDSQPFSKHLDYTWRFTDGKPLPAVFFLYHLPAVNASKVKVNREVQETNKNL